LAQYLLHYGAEKVVLVGRSGVEAAKGRLGKGILADERILYRSADVSDADALAAEIAAVRDLAGPIRGVFHLAGFLNDGYFIKKSIEDFQTVAAPKLAGAEALDRATAKDPLDRFVVFSSIASVCGSEGQTDYAYANAAMDAFVDRRLSDVAAGRRKGRTVSVAWPLWEEGGMEQDAPARERLYYRTGLMPMPSDAALSALDTVFDCEGHVIVSFGNRRRFEALPSMANAFAETPERRSVAIREKCRRGGCFGGRSSRFGPYPRSTCRFGGRPSHALAGKRDGSGSGRNRNRRAA
jgi:polyketide synthase PksN